MDETMLHLYRNPENETVAADSQEQAADFYDRELAGRTPRPAEWFEVPDDLPVTLTHSGRYVTKKASEWAAECDAPECVAVRQMTTGRRKDEDL